MRRFLAALLALFKGFFKSLFAWAMPSAPPAPDDDGASQRATVEGQRPGDDDPLPLGHALALKQAACARAKGAPLDAAKMAKIHPGLIAWLRSLTPEEAGRVARETCSTIRRHLTSAPCIEGVPGLAGVQERVTTAMSTELGRRLTARRIASSRAPDDDEDRVRGLARMAF